uniref:IGFBP N-terminal domain-containing protein n=1 Tax=Timema monikensis TaxID=170555 RepID=A0A7R9E5U5_9NEOP|nr:unnamed protein product [Timema monikensis]
MAGFLALPEKPCAEMRACNMLQGVVLMCACAVTLAIVCEKDSCAKVECDVGVSKESCVDGEFNERGSFCGCCATCDKHLGQYSVRISAASPRKEKVVCSKGYKVYCLVSEEGESCLLQELGIQGVLSCLKGKRKLLLQELEIQGVLSCFRGRRKLSAPKGYKWKEKVVCSKGYKVYCLVSEGGESCLLQGIQGVLSGFRGRRKLSAPRDTRCIVWFQRKEKVVCSKGYKVYCLVSEEGESCLLQGIQGVLSGFKGRRKLSAPRDTRCIVLFQRKEKVVCSKGYKVYCLVSEEGESCLLQELGIQVRPPSRSVTRTLVSGPPHILYYFEIPTYVDSTLQLKMRSTRGLLVCLLTLSCVLGALGVVCTPNFCDSVRCQNVDLETCHGEYQPNGGTCGCCSICIKILREGNTCPGIPLRGGPPPIEKCDKGLDCKKDVYGTYKCTRIRY